VPPRLIEAALAETAATVDQALDRLLPTAAGPERRVVEAMRYAVLGPGKRLRPFLVLTGARLFNVAEEGALRAAAAVEMVHCYSLVHDDLLLEVEVIAAVAVKEAPRKAKKKKR